MTMRTYSQKPSEVKRSWHLLDASELPLGRLSTIAASLLIGKGKPTVTAHVDGGDHVVIINAAKLVVTGGKAEKKVYYRHSNYPGGIKSATLTEKLIKDPSSIVFSSVRGMLPDNKLRSGRLDRLKVYPSNEHGHEAQKPQKIETRKIT